MTRDEAIYTYRKIGLVSIEKEFFENLRPDKAERIISECARETVDALIALGVLDLDEPKSIKDRVCTAIWGHPELKRVAPSYVIEAIDKADLKIVEK